MTEAEQIHEDARRLMAEFPHLRQDMSLDEWVLEYNEQLSGEVRDRITAIIDRYFACDAA
jgi:DNA-binding SARP family transcriptional activator